MKKSIRELSEKLPKQIVRLEVGSFRANCYLLFDSKKNCVIIDAGDDAEFIEEKIRELSLVPKVVLATHGHFDHLTAASVISLAYGIPFYMSKKDEFLLKNIRGLQPAISKDLQGGDKVEAGEISLEVLEVPGHTPGSLAFRLEKEQKVFCGDLFFADGMVGRTDFNYSDKATLEKSTARLRKLSKKTVFYPGHGEEFGNM